MQICSSLEKLQKFLGIIIDSKLTFKHHFEIVLSKLSSVSGIIFINRDYIPRKDLRMLYLSLGWSYLTYGIVVWGNSSITFGNKIQAISESNNEVNFWKFRSTNLQK